VCRDSAEDLFPEGARERGESGEIGVRDLIAGDGEQPSETKVEQIRRSRSCTPRENHAATGSSRYS
jgi:hypothetical protein